MDNLTHSLCGWALARAGMAQLGAWATPTLIIAANLPDVENIVSPEGFFVGPWSNCTTYLAEHRGLTHSFVGLGVMVVVVGLLVWLLGRIFKLHDRPRWWAAMVVVAAGILSHLLLDWFNTYGIRPFLPWDASWYYGDLAFIVDPWMWMILGGGIFLGTKRIRSAYRLWLFLGVMTTSILFLAARPTMIPESRNYYGYFISWADNKVGFISWTVVLIWMILALIIIILRVLIFSTQPTQTPARLSLLVWTIYVATLFLGSRTATMRTMNLLAANNTNRRLEVKTSANPIPAVPWRFQVLAQTETAIERISVNLLCGTTQRLVPVEANLRDPILATIQGTPEYRAWITFARHRVFTHEGGLLKLGDMRFRIIQRRDWSEMSVPIVPKT
ncbi:MAG: metal-dependent hydrolase [Planctomycetota bacterium]